MPFIPLNLNDAEESKPAPVGKYNLIITGCEETTTKAAGKPQFKINISIEDLPNAPPLSHYQGIPSEKDEPDAQRFKMLLLRRFLTLFKIPYDPAGFDTTELAMGMVGASAKAEVQLSEPNDNGDVYNRLVLPKVANEEGRKAAPKPPGRKAA